MEEPAHGLREGGVRAPGRRRRRGQQLRVQLHAPRLLYRGVWVRSPGAGGGGREEIQCFRGMHPHGPEKRQHRRQGIVYIYTKYMYVYDMIGILYI